MATAQDRDYDTYIVMATPMTGPDTVQYVRRLILRHELADGSVSSNLEGSHLQAPVWRRCEWSNAPVLADGKSAGYGRFLAARLSWHLPNVTYAVISPGTVLV